MGMFNMYGNSVALGATAAGAQSDVDTGFDGAGMERTFFLKKIEGYVRLEKAAPPVSTLEGIAAVLALVNQKSAVNTKLTNAITDEISGAEWNDDEAYDDYTTSLVETFWTLPIQFEAQTDAAGLIIWSNGSTTYKFTKTFKKPIPLAEGTGFKLQILNDGNAAFDAVDALTYHIRFKGGWEKRAAVRGF